jgi:hypothetical protein
MISQNSHPDGDKPSMPVTNLLTTMETAKLLKVSASWLAKARMRGEGPPFIKVGRSIRYLPLEPWLAAQRRSSKKR